MVTMAQLRAVLAVLNVEPDQPGVLRPVDPDHGVEQAKLAGLVHRVLGDEVRRVIGTADDADQRERRWSAAAGGLPPTAEVTAERARFDARQLSNRIEVLAADAAAEPVPVLLDAAARAADAAAVLVQLSRHPLGAETETLWRAALDDLAAAYHLINDEHEELAATATRPLGGALSAP
ncbi:hypothetical protein [Nocardia sp. NPDC057227]|uniref:hypothetical protein n=1 Tax=Nocardia sp. NPDC057227 TaxID=3346056 RepID=UPI00363EF0D5